MNYSEKEMAALINEVETQFSNHLKKAENDETTTLAKSEETNEVVLEDNSEETSTDLNKSEESGFDYDEEDFDNMDTMYASMTKAEQSAHYASLSKSLSIEAPASDESAGTDLNKSETVTNDLHKSEIASKDEEIGELKKSLEQLTSAMSKFVKARAPQRKAVTNIEYIAKSEEDVNKSEPAKEDVSKLSKSEISKRLSAKIRSGELKKSDRDQITSFYDNTIQFDAIKHLL